jgi:hypothetical protein
VKQRVPFRITLTTPKIIFLKLSIPHFCALAKSRPATL